MYFYLPMRRRDGHSPISSLKNYKMRKRETTSYRWSALELVGNKEVLQFPNRSVFTLIGVPESKGLDPTAGLDPKVVAVYTKLV
jgi:hypothetical protein